MRLAIPIWDDRVSPVLDTASRLLLIEVENGAETSRFEVLLEEKELARRCLRIQGLGVNVLICGAVSRPFLKMLVSSGITLIPEISGAVEEVLQAYFKGTLSQTRFLMPGCKRGKVSAGICRRPSIGHSDRDHGWGKKTAERPKIT
jgi:predicted Fe-Mo cluster-binding NifX family protein